MQSDSELKGQECKTCQGSKWPFWAFALVLIVAYMGFYPFENSGYKATIDNDGLWSTDTTVVWDKSNLSLRSITDFDSIEYQPGLVDGNVVWEERSLLHTKYRLQINNSADLMNITLPVGKTINIVFGADL